MILTPFKWIVALFFNWSNALFNDPGWAVVGMSVLLSLLLTPLYIWIERRKNSDKAKCAPMQAEIDKIEAVYSGRERFYYTREIQRRYHYSPWTAMIPTLGLLVQIPFLLAAYHYLSELQIFNGASFFYIKDLSKPDTIATVAGLPINLLAILMTLINLVSGWRYAESGKTKERVQYMAVAAIFLVLLYNCAASVVLYWTLSNALSLVRSEVFFRKKGAVASSVIRMYVVAAYMRTSVQFLLGLSVVFAVDMFFYPGATKEFGFRVATRLAHLSQFCIVVAGVVCAVVVAVRSRMDRCRKPFAFDFLCYLMLALISVPFAVLFLSMPVSEQPLLNWLNDIGLPLAAVVAVVAICICWDVAFGIDQKPCPELCGAGPRAPRRTSLLVFLLALNIALQQLFCGPVSAYASFPEGAEEVSFVKMVALGITLSVLLAAAAAFIALALPSRLHAMFTKLLFLLFGMLFIYGNIVSADYGVLFQGHFSKAENMRPSLDLMVLEAIFVVVFVMAVFRVWNVVVAKRRMVVSILVIVAFSYFVRTGYSLVKMDGGLKVKAGGDVVSSNGKYFRFSRNARNVVFIILDNFMGHRLGPIVDTKPELRKELEGFTWYPNTISASTYTFPDVAAIWGGEDYFPYKIGTRMKLQDVFVSAWSSYRAKISKEGWRLATSSMVEYFGGSLEGAEAVFGEMRYRRRSDRGEKGTSVNEISLKRNAWLRSVPFVFRQLIYDGGRWGCDIRELVNPLDGAFDFLRDLGANSEVVDLPTGLYVHIHSEATHSPFLTPVDGQLECIGADESFKWSLERVVDWLKWMKANGVYDNTRIVICSDHGVEKEKIAELDPRYAKNVDDMRKAAGNIPPSAFFALLMTKDFLGKMPFAIDRSTKTISHAAYFAFSDTRFFDPVSEICPSGVKNPYPADWRTRLGFEPFLNFRIAGDASDGKNWIQIGGGVR